MNSALWLPLFDELADPLVVVRVAAEAVSLDRLRAVLRNGPLTS